MLSRAWQSADTTLGFKVQGLHHSKGEKGRERRRLGGRQTGGGSETCRGDSKRGGREERSQTAAQDGEPGC